MAGTLMRTLFISDLHLHESRPYLTRAFFRFLQEQAKNAEALYILGDFFDAWIGDDDDTDLAIQVAEQLQQLSATGVRIYLMHGNRDFLLGSDFAKAAGAELIPEFTVIDLYGTPTILLHGDSLCTKDTAYQHFRLIARNADWQQQQLSQPLAIRRQIAAHLREKSQSMNSLKAEDIMDVTADEVISLMQKTHVKRMIHGHTHRPARHSLTIDGQAAERIVLGDWHHEGWCLVASEHTLELQHWPI